MPRKVGHAIHVIFEAIDRIEQITGGKSLSEFEASRYAGSFNERLKSYRKQVARFLKTL